MVMHTHVRRAEMLVLNCVGSALSSHRVAHRVNDLAKADRLSAATSGRISRLDIRQAHMSASLRASCN